MSTENTDEHRSIVRWMMLATWVVALALLTLFVNRWLERSRNPNNAVVTSIDGNRRSITLQQGSRGHYMVTGTINGVEVDFLLDTGATSVSVPLDIAQKIGLEKGPATPIITANGRAIAYQTKIDSITIGELETRNATAHINPGLTHEVLLGMSVLRNYELIQRGNQLIIREP